MKRLEEAIALAYKDVFYSNEMTPVLFIRLASGHLRCVYVIDTGMLLDPGYSYEENNEISHQLGDVLMYAMEIKEWYTHIRGGDFTETISEPSIWIDEDFQIIRWIAQEYIENPSPETDRRLRNAIIRFRRSLI